MKSSRPVSAHWRSSNSRTVVPALGDTLEEDAPRGEQHVAAAGRRRLEAEQRQQGRLDPAPVLLVGDVLGDRLARSRSRVVASSSRLGQARPPADHLAERPERDALAVGRRAAAVPVDVLDDAVDVLLELPGEAALADARRAR